MGVPQVQELGGGLEGMLERGTRTSMGKGVAWVANSRAFPVTRRKYIFEENAFAVSSCWGRKQKGPFNSLGVPAEGRTWAKAMGVQGLLGEEAVTHCNWWGGKGWKGYGQAKGSESKARGWGGAWISSWGDGHGEGLKLHLP